MENSRKNLRLGPKFWLGPFIDLRLRRMNCIWDDLFTDTPHEHIRHAKYHMWLYLAYSGVFFSTPNMVKWGIPDMRFVRNFTPPDFQAKTFTLSISPNFNSFSDTNTKSEWKWRNLHCWLMMLRLWQKLFNEFKHLMPKWVVPLTSNRKSTP